MTFGPCIILQVNGTTLFLFLFFFLLYSVCVCVCFQMYAYMHTRNHVSLEIRLGRTANTFTQTVVLSHSSYVISTLLPSQVAPLSLFLTPPPCSPVCLPNPSPVLFCLAHSELPLLSPSVLSAHRSHGKQGGPDRESKNGGAG